MFLKEVAVAEVKWPVGLTQDFVQLHIVINLEFPTLFQKVQHLT